MISGIAVDLFRFAYVWPSASPLQRSVHSRKTKGKGSIQLGYIET